MYYCNDVVLYEKYKILKNFLNFIKCNKFRVLFGSLKFFWGFFMYGYLNRSNNKYLFIINVLF